MPNFRVEFIGERLADAAQANAKKATATLRSSPFGDGRMLSVDFDGTNPTIVDHGLGRELQGFVVCGMTAAASPSPGIIWQTDPQPTGMDLSLQVSLRCSGSAATASIWFY